MATGSGQRRRDRLDRPQVGGHVLAGRAVAACRALDEPAALVAQRDREAVDLELGDVLQVRGRFRGRRQPEALADASIERAELVVAEGVRQAEHRAAMADFAERPGRRAADALGRRLGRRERRMGGLERDEPPEQLVVLGVGEFRARPGRGTARSPGHLGRQASRGSAAASSGDSAAASSTRAGSTGGSATVIRARVPNASAARDATPRPPGSDYAPDMERPDERLLAAAETGDLAAIREARSPTAPTSTRETTMGGRRSWSRRRPARPRRSASSSRPKPMSTSRTIELDDPFLYAGAEGILDILQARERGRRGSDDHQPVWRDRPHPRVRARTCRDRALPAERRRTSMSTTSTSSAGPPSWRRSCYRTAARAIRPSSRLLIEAGADVGPGRQGRRQATEPCTGARAAGDRRPPRGRGATG